MRLLCFDSPLSDGTKKVSTLVQKSQSRCGIWLVQSRRIMSSLLQTDHNQFILPFWSQYPVKVENALWMFGFVLKLLHKQESKFSVNLWLQCNSMSWCVLLGNPFVEHFLSKLLSAFLQRVKFWINLIQNVKSFSV